MKILVTGCNGQVGRELVARGVNAGHEVRAYGHADLDIADERSVERLLGKSAADLVINAAAYTAVDRAEQEPEKALRVNRDGPAHLASACAGMGIPLLHISTDYVFDGAKSGSYREDDPVSPLGVYGRSKWEGEEAVRRLLPEHLILRVSWVFGIHGSNFVKTMLRLAREREELRVVADQQGCPTFAGDIADALLAIAGRIDSPPLEKGGQGGFWGAYHYCGAPAVTWHGFAQTIVERARAYEALKARRVVPIATADYPTPARRPANSVLDCNRIGECFGIQSRPWLDGLEAVLISQSKESNL